MLRAWKVAFIGVLLAIIPEQRSVLWAQDAKDDPTKPAPNPLEELIKRTQEPTKDQTKETPKEDPSKPAQDSNVRQTLRAPAFKCDSDFGTWRRLLAPGADRHVAIRRLA